ncbi:hypothetical protein ACFQBQ_15310 [Granulicella cerasi]|uniref:Uncharacterized protein n=1 Tax=Granulicella cerasi TaxID=741063 RepID=A0ABW1ZBQ4_9BACT|nr:hypothetical protein [Granulicella cerasi]
MTQKVWWFRGFATGLLVAAAPLALAQDATPPKRISLHPTTDSSAPTPSTSTPPATTAPASAAPVATAPGVYAQPARTSVAAPASSTPAPAAKTAPVYPRPVYAQPVYAQPGRETAPATSAQPTEAAPAPAPASPRKIVLFQPKTEAAPPPASTPEPVAPPAAEKPIETEAVEPPAAAPAPRATPVRGKPTRKPIHPAAKQELIVVQGKPMLDELGVQRTDADGKLMFEPEERQLRDKNGKPVFVKGKPVFQTPDNLGYDERGRRIRPPKEETARRTGLKIESGALMVDGIVGKVRLNYEIAELHYLYVYVPDTGVIIIGTGPFAGATRQLGAFRGESLSVHTEEHTIKLSSDRPLIGNKPLPAYVAVDRGFILPHAPFPVLGYGSTRLAPYVWPGSKAEAQQQGVSAAAPEIKKELKPRLEGQACAAGVRCSEVQETPTPATATSAPKAAPAGAPAIPTAPAADAPPAVTDPTPARPPVTTDPAPAAPASETPKQ